MTQWVKPWVYPSPRLKGSAWVYLCYERTNVRTYGEAWLSSRDLLTFRNARAHIQEFPSDLRRAS